MCHLQAQMICSRIRPQQRTAPFHLPPKISRKWTTAHTSCSPSFRPPLCLCFMPSSAPLAFRSAVDWSERWIQGILVFHLSLWLFFIVTRKSFGAQVRAMCRTCILPNEKQSLRADLARHRVFVPT